MSDAVRNLSSEQRKGVIRAGFKRLVTNTSTDGLLDGPKFAQAFEQHRDLFKAAGINQQNLADLDALAKELKGYKFSKPEHSTWGGYAMKGMVAGAAAGIAGSAFGMSPMHAILLGAGTSAVRLGTPAVMLRIMMVPEGPGVLARALKIDKVTPELKALLYGMPLAAGVNKSQENRPTDQPKADQTADQLLVGK